MPCTASKWPRLMVDNVSRPRISSGRTILWMQLVSEPFLGQFERLRVPSYLDGQLAGGFSAHLEVGNRCSQGARGHDGDKNDGELHRGGLSISIG